MRKFYFRSLPVGSFFYYCGIEYLKTNQKYEKRNVNALCLDTLAEGVGVSFKETQWVEAVY